MIFLGDLIDAGKLVKKPNDLGILQRVSQLISDGHASCILGNHELNAILFHRRSSALNAPLRSHKEQNTKQHKSFIEAFGVESSDALSWTAWMLETLPLWLEFDGLRIAHACWSEKAINIVKKRRPSGHLQLEDLEEVAAKKLNSLLLWKLLPLDLKPNYQLATALLITEGIRENTFGYLGGMQKTLLGQKQLCQSLICLNCRLMNSPQS